MNKIILLILIFDFVFKLYAKKHLREFFLSQMIHFTTSYLSLKVLQNVFVRLKEDFLKGVIKVKNDVRIGK